MKNSKKLVSLLTAIVMMLSMVSMVSATETATVIVKPIKLMSGELDATGRDALSITNVIAQSTTIHHRYDIPSTTAECPVYICTPDFKVTLLVDAGNCYAYNLSYREKYSDSTTGREFENIYVASSSYKMEKTAGSTFTRPEESKRPQGEEIYVVKGPIKGGGQFGAVIKVVDSYTPAEGDIPVAELGAAQPAPEATPVPEVVAPAGKMATPSTSAVRADRYDMNTTAYVIDGYNYFKIRDVAYGITQGSGRMQPFYGFDVAWNGEKNAIEIVKGELYTGDNGLVVSDGVVKEATPCTSTIYVDGVAVELSAYTIGGNNYVKLRDLCKALNYNVTWNGETNSIGISTIEGYQE